jgi:hypothetical protein
MKNAIEEGGAEQQQQSPAAVIAFKVADEFDQIALQRLLFAANLKDQPLHDTGRLRRFGAGGKAGQGGGSLRLAASGLRRLGSERHGGCRESDRDEDTAEQNGDQTAQVFGHKAQSMRFGVAGCSVVAMLRAGISTGRDFNWLGRGT